MHSVCNFIFSEYKINSGHDMNALQSWKSCIVTPAVLVKDQVGVGGVTSVSFATISFVLCLQACALTSWFY